MATIKNGILGGFTGKVGNVVGYRTYGEDRMRSISERTAPATPAELKNRKQFKLVQDTLNCIKELIKIGFKDYWTKTGGTRGAISYNKTHAVQVNGDDCMIDPKCFRFSGGILPGLKNASIELERPDLLRFNWSTESAYEASPKDQVMLLAIDLEGKQACYESLGNFRGSGTDVLNLDDDLRGKELDIYIAVVAKDRSKQSDSQYLGRIKVQGLNQDGNPIEHLAEPEQSNTDLIIEATDSTATLIELSDQEFKETISNEIISVTVNEALETDIQPYIRKLQDQGVLGPCIPQNELRATAYRTNTSNFKHLHLPDQLKKNLVVIVTDLNEKMIKGHYYFAKKIDTMIN